VLKVYSKTLGSFVRKSTQVFIIYKRVLVINLIGFTFFHILNCRVTLTKL